MAAAFLYMVRYAFLAHWAHAFLLLEEVGVRHAEAARAELTTALEKVGSNFSEEDDAAYKSLALQGMDNM